LRPAAAARDWDSAVGIARQLQRPLKTPELRARVDTKIAWCYSFSVSETRIASLRFPSRPAALRQTAQSLNNLLNSEFRAINAGLSSHALERHPSETTIGPEEAILAALAIRTSRHFPPALECVVARRVT